MAGLKAALKQALSELQAETLALAPWCLGGLLGRTFGPRLRVKMP
jgi:hypothetical protein